MIVSVNKNSVVRIDAVADGNMASFTIPADICDECRTIWSTWRIFRVHEGIESPLCVAGFQRWDGN